jgi:hypothetical protein
MGVREMGEEAGVVAVEKFKRSGRPHGGNFRKRVAWKYLMCQLFCQLVFEWIRKTLKRCTLEVLKV